MYFFLASFNSHPIALRNFALYVKSLYCLSSSKHPGGAATSIFDDGSKLKIGRFDYLIKNGICFLHTYSFDQYTNVQGMLVTFTFVSDDFLLLAPELFCYLIINACDKCKVALQFFIQKLKIYLPKINVIQHSIIFFKDNGSMVLFPPLPSLY